MIAASGAMVATFVGREVVVESTTATYSTLKSLLGFNQHVDTVLEELDIQTQLKIVESLLKSINDDPKIHVCLNEVNEIIQKIHWEMEKMYHEIDVHPQKWFASYRSPNCNKELQNLRKYSKIMDKRVEMLIKLTTLFNLQKSG